MRGHMVVMGIVCLTAGCIYLEEVNYPPEVSLIPEQEGPYVRGAAITLRAETKDRNAGEDGSVQLTWSLTDDQDNPLRSDQATNCSTFSGGCFVPHALDVVYRLTVVAADERGATATDHRDFTVENRGPTAKLTVNGRKSASQHYLIHQTVTLSGLESTDPDSEDRCLLTYEYAVVDKPLGSAAFDSIVDDCGTDVAPEGCTGRKPTVCYWPDVSGTYRFSVKVTDPAGASDSAEVTFEVDPDGLPCLAQLVPSPIALIFASRSDGSRHFSVNVTDELDPWPPTDTNAPGFPTFTWSLQTAGDPLPVPIPDYTSNQYELDLIAFSAGEEILVRVDMSDRVDRSQTSPCAVDEPTCPPDSDPLAGACVQRVTWTLRVY